jgi:hypothetical protein
MTSAMAKLCISGHMVAVQGVRLEWSESSSAQRKRSMESTDLPEPHCG